MLTEILRLKTQSCRKKHHVTSVELRTCSASLDHQKLVPFYIPRMNTWIPSADIQHRHAYGCVWKWCRPPNGNFNSENDEKPWDFAVIFHSCTLRCHETWLENPVNVEMFFSYFQLWSSVSSQIQDLPIFLWWIFHDFPMVHGGFPHISPIKIGEKALPAMFDDEEMEAMFQEALNGEASWFLLSFGIGVPKKWGANMD